jgi:hypothetical protein
MKELGMAVRETRLFLIGSEAQEPTLPYKCQSNIGTAVRPW